MKVILDTSGWYAVAVKGDRNHLRAKQFAQEGHELVVLETVFEEILALLQNRYGKKMAVMNGLKLRNVGITKLGIDESAAWRLFEETGSKISYVDCSVAVKARKLEVPVFTFDSDFKKLDVEVVPDEN